MYNNNVRCVMQVPTKYMQVQVQMYLVHIHKIVPFIIALKGGRTRMCLRLTHR